jgi:hypothetical protein
MNEAASQSHIRLAAANQHLQLWRNNTGVAVDDTGRHVRYGLCNDSKQLNDKIKSSDLIGITPVLITPEYYGRILGVFTAVETKAPGWKYRDNDARAVAQKRFHDIVKAAGGFAGFAQTVDDFLWIIERGRK